MAVGPLLHANAGGSGRGAAAERIESPRLDTPPSGPIPIPYPNLGALVRVLVHVYGCHPVGVEFLLTD